jgi:hypothetical protein
MTWTEIWFYLIMLAVCGTIILGLFFKGFGLI